MSPHTHELAATFMMGLLDYETLTVGCHTCGVQWVVTLNWADRTLTINWTNVPWRVYFDSPKRILQVETDRRDDDAREV